MKLLFAVFIISSVLVSGLYFRAIPCANVHLTALINYSGMVRAFPGRRLALPEQINKEKSGGNEENEKKKKEKRKGRKRDKCK